MSHVRHRPPPTPRTVRTSPRSPLRRVRRAALAAAVAVAGAAGACSDGSQPARFEAPRGASRVITGLGTEITSDGRRALRIEADSGFGGEDTGVLTLVGVEARAFDVEGLVRVTLEADSGRLDETTRVFTALGNVRVRTQDGGVTLETAALSYDPSTGQLRSDSAVVVEGRGRTERGTCFEGDPLLTSWRVCGSGS